VSYLPLITTSHHHLYIHGCPALSASPHHTHRAGKVLSFYFISLWFIHSFKSISLLSISVFRLYIHTIKHCINGSCLVCRTKYFLGNCNFFFFVDCISGKLEIYIYIYLLFVCLVAGKIGIQMKALNCFYDWDL
jgi:hypothetical protein